MHQTGEVGVGTSFSIATLMNESCRDFILSMSMSLSGYLVGRGEDILIWQLNRSGVFDVRSFYIALLKAISVSFPW